MSASLLSRYFLAEWRLKLLLTLLLNAFFWTGYILLSRYPIFSAREMPLLPFEESIPFSPEFWSWVYVSEFLITGLLPWTLRARETLLRYTNGILLLMTLSFSGYALWPVMSPRIDVGNQAGLFGLIAAYGGGCNAFPSLHAGFLVYMLALGCRVYGRHIPPAGKALFLGWGGLILYSTLATRQHYLIDLVIGALLGWLADAAAWRSHSSPALKMEQNRGPISHSGLK